ncbi:hypothetical protein NEMBOFW57_004103 [Staphylotrichum longicolle]|uniref:Heterokaryon incompatibility domain-containing protein n=1 Tax=Staphylotrichum longicolle TaxID=669026 RepID=A0AAD4F659_9PEZI|nr:hypothetical protein NEMBOFW57_004103 [Staphylotrichum longicolle]
MAAIYTHSALTIAASQAPSSSSSLFSSQSSTPIAIASFTVHARHATKHLPRHPDPATFPLLTRAWVYQERLLSRRVVHFGPDELAWECHYGIQCQCGYFDRADQRYLTLHDDRRGMNSKAQHTAALLRAVTMAKRKHLEARFPSQIPEARPSLLPAHWRKMVTEYSPLALSRASDRLPALSGLAKQVRQFRDARYLAGLWEDTFFRDALWVAAANPGRRSAEWVAPTWSWASQRGGVRYTNGERLQLGGLGVYRPAELGNFGDVTSELVGGSCELVAAECVPAGVDDTGRVEKGWVKVYDGSKLEDMHEYHEHQRETSPWFGKVKEAVVITIV